MFNRLTDPVANFLKKRGPTAATALMSGGLTLRQNFSWNLLGNVIYAACQWGMLIVLANLTSTEEVGDFAFAIAICTPVILLANLQLRTLQATDFAGHAHVGEYFTLRLFTTTIAFFAIVVLLVAIGADRYTATLVLAVTVGKCFDAISDICFGAMQRIERMDLIARSMVFNGFVSLIALAVGVWTTGSLIVGACASSAVSGIALLVLNLPIYFQLRAEPQPAASAVFTVSDRSEKYLGLAWTALPMGLVTMLISLNPNVPRYVIERLLGRSELGVFAAISYLMVAGTTLITAVTQTVSPRLARYAVERRTDEIHRLTRLIGSLFTVLSAAAILLTVVAGTKIVAIIYGDSYANSPALLYFLVAATVAGFYSSLFGTIVTA
ncbi:MAG: oligosaccharide flippase family protein, partial [Thermomicrobiales bacterium]|nr:oligosaccharide flippase family protein [Thermomicrobiales bacterium]